MQRLIEIGWACGGPLALKVLLLARNRVISSVICFLKIHWFWMGHLVKIISTTSTIGNLVLIFIICGICLGCVSFQSSITSTPDIPKATKQTISATLPLKERWRWSGKIGKIFAIKNRIIVVNRVGKQQILVFDAETADILWKSLPMTNIRSVAADKNRVYVGTISNVQAFDLENGQKMWQGVE